MSRATTSDELVKLRASGQWSELYLAIHKPAVVMACRVNSAVLGTDEVTEIPFDTVTTGAYTDILAGQTVYVGTSAGAYDLGMVRVRKAASSTNLPIGATSEIVWADNAYLTVVNEFNLWAKHWNTPDETTVYMDWDITYTDGNTNFDPYPILGPDAVLWLTGSTISFSPTASGSWAINSSITGYSWTAPGASATSGLTTISPTITYNAVGTYRIACTLTAANGKTATGYRVVFVYSAASMPVTAFTLETCAGAAEDGGWSFAVNLTDQAALTDVRDRAKCILFAKEYFNSTAGSVGPVTGYENIIAEGWIDEESIDWDAEQGAVKFSVRGPAYWLSRLAAYSGGLKNGTDVDWKFASDLTIDMALHNLFHWRSTVSTLMDFYPSNDTRIASGLTTSPGAIWNQIKEISNRILADPRCDRYGRLYVQTDTQYLPTASRSSIPIVQAITAADWTDRISIPRKTVTEMAMLETGGTDNANPYFSRSSGKIPGKYGSIETKDNLLVASQDDLNSVTGAYVARTNNPYPNIGISLSANNRMMDIAPRQYLTLTIAAGDTERGLTWTAQKIIPRRISFAHDPETGWLATELECEAETLPGLAVTVIPPAVPTPAIPEDPANPNDPTKPYDPFNPLDPNNPNDPFNPWNPDNFPPIPPFGDFPPSPGMPGDPGYTPPIQYNCADNLMASGNGPFALGFSPISVMAGSSAIAVFPCSVRKTGSFYPTEIRMDGVTFYGDSAFHYSVAAVDAGGAVIVSGTIVGSNTWRFAPLAGTNVGGFKISIDSGGSTSYIPGDYINSGAVLATNTSGDNAAAGLTPGDWYCIESSGIYNAGPFNSYGLNIMLDGINWVNGSYSELNTSGLYPTHNTREYFQIGSTGSVMVRVDDTSLGDNSGSMGWTLRRAIVASSRQVSVNPCSLYNVCDAV